MAAGRRILVDPGRAHRRAADPPPASRGAPPPPPAGTPSAAGLSMTSSVPSVTPAPPFPWLGLVVLAAAVFLSVTIEMLPTGLLPDMSSGLQVGEPLIGVLVTV